MTKFKFSSSVAYVIWYNLSSTPDQFLQDYMQSDIEMVIGFNWTMSSTYEGSEVGAFSEYKVSGFSIHPLFWWLGYEETNICVNGVILEKSGLTTLLE